MAETRRSRPDTTPDGSPSTTCFNNSSSLPAAADNRPGTAWSDDTATPTSTPEREHRRFAAQRRRRAREVRRAASLELDALLGCDVQLDQDAYDRATAAALHGDGWPVEYLAHRFDLTPRSDEAVR